MTVTIPEWVLWLPIDYLVIGLLLTLPLLAWSNRGFSRHEWHYGWNKWQPWVFSTLLWPAVIWELWATPRRNKKVLARWKEQQQDG